MPPRSDRPEPTPDQPDLRTLLRPIWQRKWLIVLLAVAVGVGTYSYYDGQARVYTASSSIFVGQSQAQAAVSGSELSSDRSLQNTATLLRTPTLAKRVADRINFRGDPQTILDSFSASPVTGADFLRITATWGTAKGAADVANAIAREFVGLRSTNERASLQRSLNGNKAQLKSIPKGVAGAQARSALQPTIDQLQLALSLPTGGAQLVQPAFPAASATSPKPKRNTVYSVILALLVGIGLAYGFERFDRRLKGMDAIRSAFNNEPVLAVVPRGDDTDVINERGNSISGDFREPFRDLLTNVQLMALDQPLRKVLVTSAAPGEGKSTVVRNLAIVLREYGLSVAVVDADLRRPTQVALLHVKEDQLHGLSTVLTGQSSLEEAMHDVAVDVKGLDTLERLRKQSGHAPGPWASDGGGDSANLGGLRLLSAGPLPANPQAVLGADRTRQVIDELAITHDIVLIDSPPLLAVSDSVPLLSQADAVIIVSRLGVATRDSASRLIELLDRIPGERWIGVVANDVRIGAFTYSYGYAYGYKAKLRRKLETGGEDNQGRQRWWRRARKQQPTPAAPAKTLEETTGSLTDADPETPARRATPQDKPSAAQTSDSSTDDHPEPSPANGSLQTAETPLVTGSKRSGGLLGRRRRSS